MNKTEKFKDGDRVIRIGTMSPVMTVKGKTLKGGLPYTTLMNTWTCFWQDSEPYWEEIAESELELISD